jgi:epoxyqueuosine reductase
LEETRVSGSESETADSTLASKIVSVGRLRELREDLDTLVRECRLSDNKTFRAYLGELSFDIPTSFPHARSIVILATSSSLMWVRFHLNGETHDVMIPPQYYSSGVSAEALRSVVLTDVIGEPGCDVVRADAVQLKPLAVRSGLAQYGRNNICYVEGMGSFLTLHAYFTDAALDEDDWGEIRVMGACRSCELCMKACPCGCIDAGNPVVDVGKCLTLYNEIAGEFPAWVSRDAHNALMGCMRCQLCCPANRDVIRRAGRLEDITEQETRRILEGTPDAELLESLSSKLRRFPPAHSEEYFPLLTRNLRVLLEKRGHVTPPGA